MSAARFCKRDGRKLRSDNKNPDQLCGYCQAGSRPKSKKPITTAPIEREFVAKGETHSIVDAKIVCVSVRYCGECPLLDTVMERCHHPSLDRARQAPSLATMPKWCPIAVVPLRISAAAR